MPAPPSVAELRTRLDGLTIRDAVRLGRRLDSPAVTIAGVQVSICDPRQVLDRLPAKPRAKDSAHTYADLRRRVDAHASPDPSAQCDGEVTYDRGARPG